MRKGRMISAFGAFSIGWGLFILLNPATTPQSHPPLPGPVMLIIGIIFLVCGIYLAKKSKE